MAVVEKKAPALPVLYQARQSFNTLFQGVQVSVSAGDLVEPGHPILEGREELFAPLRIRFLNEAA